MTKNWRRPRYTSSCCVWTSLSVDECKICHYFVYECRAGTSESNIVCRRRIKRGFPTAVESPSPHRCDTCEHTAHILLTGGSIINSPRDQQPRPSGGLKDEAEIETRQSAANLWKASTRCHALWAFQHSRHTTPLKGLLSNEFTHQHSGTRTHQQAPRSAGSRCDLCVRMHD